MDISRLVMSSIGRRNRKLERFEPPSFGDDSGMSKFDKLIARAARSWNTEFPGRKELPRKYAKICWETMALARSKQRNPEDILPEVCRIRGVDESEVIGALEALARMIEETNYAFKENREMGIALTSRAKNLFEKLR
jgi:hypothetical protein